MAGSKFGEFQAGDMLYGADDLGTDDSETSVTAPQHALDTILQHADDTGTFLVVPNLVRVASNLEQDELDATHLEDADAWRRFIPADKQMPIDIEGDWDETNARLKMLLTDFTGEVRRMYKLFSPNNTRWAFMAYVMQFNVDAPEAEKLTFTARLLTTGEPVFS